MPHRKRSSIRTSSRLRDIPSVSGRQTHAELPRLLVARINTLHSLLIKGKTVDYYSTAAASFGFQFGAQFKTVMLIFLKKDALDKFRNSSGWEAGVDGSVALIELGAGKDINTMNLEDPIVGFVFSNKGLMYNLTLEGSKITKLDK